MSERSEFLPAPEMSAPRREPAAGGQGVRAAFFWLLFLAVKKSNSPGGAKPADLLSFSRQKKLNPGVAPLTRPPLCSPTPHPSHSSGEKIASIAFFPGGTIGKL
jgi:hypothetical protein